MLEELKQFYENQANNIVGWKKANKNDLCNLFIENEFNEPLNNYYFSAIICKYWNKIYKLYSKSRFVAQPEDCYDWLVEAIQYAIKHRKWKDPDNKLFTDPNGPDKVINRKLKHIRLNYLVAVNRYKRQSNINNASIDELYGESGDCLQPKCESDFDEDLWIQDLICEEFSKKDYLAAFVIDAIINADCFDDDSTFNIKKLHKYLRHLDDANYLTIFSESYNISLDKVKLGYGYVKNLTPFKLYQKIDQILFTFKKRNIGLL